MGWRCLKLFLERIRLQIVVTLKYRDLLKIKNPQLVAEGEEMNKDGVRSQIFALNNCKYTSSSPNYQQEREISLIS